MTTPTESHVAPFSHPRQTRFFKGFAPADWDYPRVFRLYARITGHYVMGAWRTEKGWMVANLTKAELCEWNGEVWG